MGDCSFNGSVAFELQSRTRLRRAPRGCGLRCRVPAPLGFVLAVPGGVHHRPAHGGSPPSTTSASSTAARGCGAPAPAACGAPDPGPRSAACTVPHGEAPRRTAVRRQYPAGTAARRQYPAGRPPLPCCHAGAGSAGSVYETRAHPCTRDPAGCNRPATSPVRLPGQPQVTRFSRQALSGPLGQYCLLV